MSRGLFATRTPQRPIPIGMSVNRLTVVKGTAPNFSGVDLLNQPPLLEIKPFTLRPTLIMSVRSVGRTVVRSRINPTAGADVRDQYS